MNDMPPEVRALLFGLGVATAIAVALLVFGERPRLAADVRRWIAGYPIMSSGDDELSEKPDEKPAEAPVAAIAQPDDNGIADSATERNALLFMAKADVLAQFVHAGKITETEGIRVVFGVGPSSTNQTYLAARELLKARLARLQAPQPGTPRPLTPEQRAVRDELGLSVKE